MTTPLQTTAGASYQNAAYTRMRVRWDLCRDVRGGTETLRLRKEKYLPRFEAEDPLDYDRRLEMTFAYDAFNQTVNALVGLALKHGVTLDKDVPERIQGDWENIDGQGTHGDVFAQFVLDDALTDGHAGVLTEYPVVAERPRLDEERDQEIRAYLVRVQASQIINWRTRVVGGREILSLLVIKETLEEEDGDFGVKPVCRYRVYRWVPAVGDQPSTVSYQVYLETAKAGAATTLTEEEPGFLKGPRFIPFAPVYGGEQEAMLRSKPPLLGLAYSNIDHTQVKSERRFALHVGSIPWRVVTGLADPNNHPDIVVSASRVTPLGVNVDAKIIEPTGAANGELLSELQEIEKRMAAQGLSMLQRDDKAVPTATQAKIDDSRGKSRLWRASSSLKDALEASFGFMAQYYGLGDNKGGSVTIRRDFGDMISGEDLTLLTAARARGDLTLELFLRILKMAGKLPSDVEPAEEAEAVRHEVGTVAQERSLLEGFLPGTDGAAEAKPTDQAQAGDTDLQTTQATVLNGAQITAAVEIVAKVTAGELLRGSGLGMLEIMFNLTPEQALKMMGEAGTETPTTPNPTPGNDDQAAPAPKEELIAA